MGLNSIVVIIIIVVSVFINSFRIRSLHERDHIVRNLSQAFAKVSTLGTAKPPLCRGPGEGRVSLVNGELPVVEPPVVAGLEEVRPAVVPLQGGLNAVREAPQRH